MLSDEEKKAIENLRLNVTNVGFSVYDGTTSLFKMRDIQTALNLIEKQSKEIEHWKAGMKIIEKDKNNHIERLERRIEELDSENEVLEEIKISYEKETNKLLKEKVEREKEIKDIYKMLTVEKEKNINLINTNKKLYEMGQQNAIQELINKDYVSKDKIKVKIEEAEERLKKANCLLDCKTKFKVIFKIETEIEILRSLLEKE